MAAGPDIWEVARLFRNIDARGDDLISKVADELYLTPEEVRVALRYYSAYKAEIDAWTRRLDDEAERQEAAWLREQELLQA